MEQINKLIDISSLKNNGLRKKKKKYVNKKSKNTKPELIVQGILQELGISYITQFELMGKYYDIFIEDKNLIIEVDGDYWHGKDISFTDMSLMQKRSFENDRYKDGIASINGYALIRIWESEISKDKIIELIKNIEDENLQNKG